MSAANELTGRPGAGPEIIARMKIGKQLPDETEISLEITDIFGPDFVVFGIFLSCNRNAEFRQYRD